MGTVDGCKWEGVKSGLASGLKEVAGHPSGRPAWSRGGGPDILTGRKWSCVLFSFLCVPLTPLRLFHCPLLDPVCASL